MDEHTFLIDRDWLQNELKDQKSITSAKLQPNFIDSKQQGVVIQEIKEDDLYSNLGLLDGDVLTKINEQDISDYKDLPKEFTDFALNKTGEVRLHLLRNGTDVTLTYQGTTVSTEK